MNPQAEPSSVCELVSAALLHESLLKKVKAIKNRRGGSIADIITTYGGPAIDEEYRKVLDEMRAELGEAGA